MKKLTSTARRIEAGDLHERVPVPRARDELQTLALTFNEMIERLLNRLDGNGQLRSIAIWEWEGYSNEEIARMLGCSSRSILRKLALIRTIWAKEEAG